MTEWKTDPVQLAKKMLAFIELEPDGATYSAIQERAENNGISLDTLDIALAKLHRFKRVSQKVKGDDIIYKSAKPVRKAPGSHLAWVKDNYPQMDSSNNADHPAFADCDFGYLFMTPEEAKQYKCEVKGRAYIPKKRYANTRK